MIACMLAAPASGTGKTAVTCALLAALAKRGLSPCAFKCGPDYIDPMFHRSVLGVESRNLDLFFCSEERLRELYARGSAGHGAAVVEGVMGYYDGVGGTTDCASAWHAAHTRGLKVIRVLRPQGSSLTLAAQVRGLMGFRTPHHIAGILLNRCSEMLAKSLAPMLERETGLPVLGFLPEMPEAAFESRHLGLFTAGEISDLSARIDAMAQQLEKTVDLSRLLALCECNEPCAPEPETTAGRAVIAVAKDEAFCFVYEETLEALRDAGAKIVPFSPLHDAELPREAQGLYLPGGYPELYAQQLSDNTAMRCAVADAVRRGMPTVAECGGFLYLGQHLESADGSVYPMVGALPGDGVRRSRLVRFGYADVTARQGSMLFREGESFPAHEFHYWDSTANGSALAARKPVTNRKWECAFTGPSLYAGFPHLYFAGSPVLARRFVRVAEIFSKQHQCERSETT